MTVSSLFGLQTLGVIDQFYAKNPCQAFWALPSEVTVTAARHWQVRVTCWERAQPGRGPVAGISMEPGQRAQPAPLMGQASEEIQASDFCCFRVLNTWPILNCQECQDIPAGTQNTVGHGENQSTETLCILGKLFSNPQWLSCTILQSSEVCQYFVQSTMKNT